MTESSHDLTLKHFIQQWLRRTKDDLTAEQIQLKSDETEIRKIQSSWIYNLRPGAIDEHNEKANIFGAKTTMYNEISRIFKDCYSLSITIVDDEKTK